MNMKAMALAMLLSASAWAQEKIPFEGIDQTWQNGADRRDSALWSGGKYFKPSLLIDLNYNYSFNDPIDNTVVGSTALARHNELQLAALHAGGDFGYDNMRARVMLQMGTRSTIVPRNDYSPYRGQYDLTAVYRYLSEAYAGYHIDVAYGLNIDAGLFLSYIGLNSYYQAENWEYQASYTSDNTPWFFTGARLQIFPTDRLKIEPWLINGWQTYGMFNELPGVGLQVDWRPEEWLRVIGSAYVGWDTPNAPGRVRFHTDDSVEVRYWNAPRSLLSKAAFSLTQDYGFENGDGVTAFGGSGGPAQSFVSGMLYHRLWFFEDHLGWTVGGGYIHNPGRYLALLPTGAGVLTQNPGDDFDAWDVSTNLQYMPGPYNTWGLELVHRRANTPYFSGHGGVTSKSGWSLPIGDPAGFSADLQKRETRIILSHIFRM